MRLTGLGGTEASQNLPDRRNDLNYTDVMRIAGLRRALMRAAGDPPASSRIMYGLIFSYKASSVLAERTLKPGGAARCDGAVCTLGYLSKSQLGLRGGPSDKQVPL